MLPPRRVAGNELRARMISRLRSNGSCNHRSLHVSAPDTSKTAREAHRHPSTMADPDGPIDFAAVTTSSRIARPPQPPDAGQIVPNSVIPKLNRLRP